MAAQNAVLSPNARQDVLDITAWIAKDSSRAAKAFLDTLSAALGNIGAFPNMGRVRPEFARAPYCFLPLRGFSYLIAYDPTHRPPLVLRILHTARDLPASLRDVEED